MPRHDKREKTILDRKEEYKKSKDRATTRQDKTQVKTRNDTRQKQTQGKCTQDKSTQDKSNTRLKQSEEQE
jgi:hypothetical protein